MISNEQLQSVRQQLVFLRNNKVLDGGDADKSENLHRLFMYPAMMVPSTQYAVVEAISSCLPEHARAIDPFMGSGTSLMSCLEFDFSIFGQDINPFAVLLSKAKVYKYDIPGLQSTCERVLAQIKDDERDYVDVSFANIDKWFKPDVQVALSKIRRAIQSVDNQHIRYYLWVIMSEVIRTGSNDRTSTFKLHCRSEKDIQKRNVDILKEFESLVLRGIEDIRHYWEKLSRKHSAKEAPFVGESIIRWGNSKEEICTDVKFDLLVSSPPYGDNHTTVTYGQTSYLPLQWIDPRDLNCPFDFVRTTQEIDRQSLGGRMSKREVEHNASTILEKSTSLKSFFESITEDRRENYYKTLIFISDFDECLDKIVPVMKEDAFYIWTIGNRFVGNKEVPNDSILVDLMELRGISLFDRAERHILNKKQASKNNYSNTMEKEHILIFHKEC